MERIDFKYISCDDDDRKEVTRTFADEDGLRCSDVCEAFVDFMVSAGFAEQNILDYFNED